MYIVGHSALTYEMKKKMSHILFSVRKSKELVFCYQNCTDLQVKKKCSIDQEKLLKFEAEGREFAKLLRATYVNS